MRGQRLAIKRSEALAHVRAVCLDQARNPTINYRLTYPNGGGIPKPLNVLQSGPHDCIGFVFGAFLHCDRVQPAPWPFYFDRKLFYGYANCDTVIADAKKTNILFDLVTGQPSEITAGDIVVIPRGILRHGHIGVLVGGGLVAHCSPSNQRKLGRAVAITDASIWLKRKDREYLRYRHWLPE